MSAKRLWAISLRLPDSESQNTLHCFEYHSGFWLQISALVLSPRLELIAPCSSRVTFALGL